MCPACQVEDERCNTEIDDTSPDSYAGLCAAAEEYMDHDPAAAATVAAVAALLTEAHAPVITPPSFSDGCMRLPSSWAGPWKGGGGVTDVEGGCIEGGGDAESGTEGGWESDGGSGRRRDGECSQIPVGNCANEWVKSRLELGEN